MRGGANDHIITKYTDVTQRAANGEFDRWAETPIGRLALIIILDQFPRTVWAVSPKAYAQDPKALALCLEGFENGHFDALPNVWFKTAFRIPLEHCECPDHMASLNRAVAICEQMAVEAPKNLRPGYQIGIEQPKKHRAVIAQFGRHSHRNGILGRKSTLEEQEYIDKGVFPHESEIGVIDKET